MTEAEIDNAACDAFHRMARGYGLDKSLSSERLWLSLRPEGRELWRMITRRSLDALSAPAEIIAAAKAAHEKHREMRRELKLVPYRPWEKLQDYEKALEIEAIMAALAALDAVRAP